VVVSVTIDRDGNVMSGHITKHSGNAAMDRSIENTLEKVTFIEPFPAGSKDQQRTYTIKFNLQAKRSLG
jgi:TonB family protein